MFPSSMSSVAEMRAIICTSPSPPAGRGGGRAGGTELLAPSELTPLAPATYPGGVEGRGELLVLAAPRATAAIVEMLFCCIVDASWSQSGVLAEGGTAGGGGVAAPAVAEAARIRRAGGGEAAVGGAALAGGGAWTGGEDGVPLACTAWLALAAAFPPHSARATCETVCSFQRGSGPLTNWREAMLLTTAPAAERAQPSAVCACVRVRMCVCVCVCAHVCVCGVCVFV